MDRYTNAKIELSAKIDSIDQSINELSQLRQSGTNVPEHKESSIRNLIDEAEKVLQSINDVNRTISENPAKFNVSEEELASRKNFANSVHQRLNNAINILNIKPAPTIQSSKYNGKEPKSNLTEADNQRFRDTVDYYQQPLLQQGDELEDIALNNTIKLLDISKQVGQEIGESNSRLKDLDTQMDRTQDQLNRLIEKTKEILSKPKTWMWTGCIILTILVFILLIWAFVV